jgi:hypothetical protein
MSVVLVAASGPAGSLAQRPHEGLNELQFDLGHLPPFGVAFSFAISAFHAFAPAVSVPFTAALSLPKMRKVSRSA